MQLYQSINEKLSTMNMKYKLKFHCKRPCQTHIECSRQILIPCDTGTVQLVLGHCLILPLHVNGPCEVDIFCFVWFLWIFSLPSDLLKALFQEASLFSTASWMPNHSNFFDVHVGFCQIPAEVIWRCAWNIWIIFKTPHGFLIDSSCIQHIQ